MSIIYHLLQLMQVHPHKSIDFILLQEYTPLKGGNSYDQENLSWFKRYH